MTEPELSDMGKAALVVAGQGRRVVPLDGKTPKLGSWPTEASRDPAVVTRWWRAQPERNIGVVLDDLVLLDGDPRHGAPASPADLGLPVTRTHRTGGGGWHLFFALPPDLDDRVLRRYVTRWFPGVDVKVGSGHLAVWPPSVHPETKVSYEVLDDRDPVPFPLGWMASEGPTKVSPRPSVASDETTGPPGPGGALEAASGSFDTKAIFQGVAAGGRDNASYKFACFMRAKGVPEADARALMETAWHAMEQPPGDEFPLEAALEKVPRAYAKFPEGHSPEFEAAVSVGLAKGPTVAATLVRMAEETYEFFQSQEGGTYAIPRDGIQVAQPLRGRQGMQPRLAAAYRASVGRIANAAALQDALTTLEGLALDAPRRTVELRLAAHEGSVVLDLGDDTGRVIVVRPGAWEPLERSPVLFRRSKLTSAIPEPVRGRPLDDMRGILNIGDEAWSLLVGYMAAAWVPDIPHPVLWLTGEQGVGKTSAMQIIASLLDPSAGRTLRIISA
jgi:hypothetical protein